MKKIVLIVGLLLCALSVSAQSGERELITRADDNFVNGQYLIALERYNELVDSYPLSEHVPDARFRIGVCLYHLGDYTQALSVFRTIPTRYAASSYAPYADFWMGIIHYRLGAYEEAVTDLGSFYKEDIKQDMAIQTLFFKALAEYRLERNHNAKSTLTLLFEQVDEYKKAPQAAALYAYLLIDTSEYEKLAAMVEPLDMTGFSSPLADKLKFYLAEAYYRTGRQQQAMDIYTSLLSGDKAVGFVAFQRLLRAKGGSEDTSEFDSLLSRAEAMFAGEPSYMKDIWILAAIEYYSQGLNELAESYISRVWNLRSSEDVSEIVPVYYVQLLSARGEADTAISVADEYIQSWPARVNLLYYHAGKVCVDNGEFEKAVSYLGRFETEPATVQFAPSMYLYAFSLYKNGAWQEVLSVADAVLESASAREYQNDFIKLKAGTYRKLGRNAEALEAYNNYISGKPDDAAAWIEYIGLLYEENKYARVAEQASAFREKVPGGASKNGYAFSFIAYIEGMASIKLQKFSRAYSLLNSVDPDRFDAERSRMVMPYVLFYKGWSAFKMAEYTTAVRVLSQLVRVYESHELSEKALYYAGWAAYSGKAYADSLDLFSVLYARSTQADFKQKALLMMAKSSAANKSIEDAVLYFKEFINKYKDSQYHAEALYEYASLLERLDKTDEALSVYARLYKHTGEGSFAEQSLYKTAELRYQMQDYRKAMQAFYDYRIAFPNGDFFDGALYWGGISANKIGERFGAVLLWEKIIEDYRESSFRPSAMQRAAEAYAETGNYSRALSRYTELIALYPEIAESLGALARAEEIKFLLLGLSNEEARLSAEIGENDGANTEEGRKAMLELSRLYIYEEAGNERLAMSMLNKVIDKSGQDPRSKGQALFLLGEYYYRQGDLVIAGNHFIDAAKTNTSDRDFMAHSLYRAAQMVMLAGRPGEAEKLVALIEKQFPSSQWVQEGRRLLKEGK